MYCYILNIISSWHLYLLAAPFSKAYYLVGIPERTDKHLQRAGSTDGTEGEVPGNTEQMSFFWPWGWETKCLSGPKSLPV